MKAASVGLIVAIVAKGLILTGVGYSVYAVSTVLSNEIWFVLGMSICVFDVQLKGRKIQGTICGLLFMILSIVVYTAEISGSAISFAMGLLACVAVILGKLRRTNYENYCCNSGSLSVIKISRKTAFGFVRLSYDLVGL